MATSDEVFELCSTVFDLIGKQDFAAVDKMLAESNLSDDRENDVMVVGLLRYSSRYRWQLGEWQGCRDRCYAKFKEVGEDADRILQGLMEDERKPDPPYMKAFDDLIGQPHPEEPE